MTALRWGILSTAHIAREKVIPGILAAERCEVAAIGSRDLDRARAVAARHGIPRVHGSYEALLADPDVDAVYVPLPNHLHEEWTIKAARAGKHVLCEKPLAMDVAAAERMIEACEREGVLLMEAFMYRLHPSWEAAVDLVRSGAIGRLVAVQSWFSYFNDDPTNIRNVRAAGGGALYDIGCYCIDLSRLLFDAEPVGVSGSIRRDPVSGVDVLTTGTLEFPTGIATFTATTRAEDDQRVHAYGTEGRLTIDIPFNVPPRLPTRIRVAQGGDPPVAPAVRMLEFPPADPYAVEAARFAAAILDGTPVPVPPSNAVADLRVIERLFAADERGLTLEGTTRRTAAGS
jgi:predicted dehydrogenase